MSVYRDTMLARDRDRERAVAVGAVQRSAGLVIALDDERMRMSEAIAITRGEDDRARLHRRDELRNRRRPAAVVSGDDDIGRERGASREQRLLDDPLDVGRDEQASTGRIDAQHTAAVVFLRWGGIA